MRRQLPADGTFQRFGQCDDRDPIEGGREGRSVAVIVCVCVCTDAPSKFSGETTTKEVSE